MTPNILQITWHDTGRWFGCYGNAQVHTPRVDRLASEGARFASCFSACAICSPSRAAMLTGRFCQDNGVMTLTNGWNDNRILPDSVHLARWLGNHGYRTAMAGVQHEMAHEHVDLIAGFGERLVSDPWPPGPIVADAAIDWLRRQRRQTSPFYLQVGLFEAHRPFDHHGCPPDAEHGLHIPPYLADTHRTGTAIAGLQGMLRRGDAALGRILDELDALGLAGDTLVSMSVDHGVELPRAKGTCYDAGHAVAWIVRLPGTVPPGAVVPQLATHIDTFPTLCGLAGLPVPGNLQGQDFAAHCRGQAEGELNNAVFGHMVENWRMLRTRRWKLIRNFRQPPVRPRSKDCDLSPRIPDNACRQLELYDLATDPDELVDLASDPGHTPIRNDLDRQLWDFLLDHRDPATSEPIRDAWQAESRASLEAHCIRQGRNAPIATGPLAVRG